MPGMQLLVKEKPNPTQWTNQKNPNFFFIQGFSFLSTLKSVISCDDKLYCHICIQTWPYPLRCPTPGAWFHRLSKRKASACRSCPAQCGVQRFRSLRPTARHPHTLRWVHREAPEGWSDRIHWNAAEDTGVDPILINYLPTFHFIKIKESQLFSFSFKTGSQSIKNIAGFFFVVF